MLPDLLCPQCGFKLDKKFYKGIKGKLENNPSSKTAHTASIISCPKCSANLSRQVINQYNFIKHVYFGIFILVIGIMILAYK